MSLEGTGTLRFGADGSLAATVDSGFQVRFGGAGAAQTFTLDVGTVGGLDGVTQLGTDSSFVVRSQDGFDAGTLASVAVGADGVIQGIYSNGEVAALDSVGLVTFANPGGLTRIGDTLYELSPASGDPSSAEAGSFTAGRVVAGTLEASNVDVAEEFVRLIEAQRGFQANARVIRASDELVTQVFDLV